MGQSEPWTVEWKKKRTKKLLLLRNSYGRVGICLHVDEPCSTCGHLKRLREEDNCYSSPGLGGGGGLDRGKGEGRTILGRITWFFWGDGWEISRRQQECPPTEFKRWTIGGIIRTLQNLRGEQILRFPPPLLSHGDKQIRPLNQHYQRKNSVALETIKLCVKRSSHFCQRNISR